MKRKKKDNGHIPFGLTDKEWTDAVHRAADKAAEEQAKVSEEAERILRQKAEMEYAQKYAPQHTQSVTLGYGEWFIVFNNVYVVISGYPNAFKRWWLKVSLGWRVVSEEQRAAEIKDIEERAAKAKEADINMIMDRMRTWKK